MAGTELEDVVAVTRRLHGDGLAASIDFFGESETDPDALRAVIDAYGRAAAALEATEADISLEIVPSHLGVDVSGDFYRGQTHRFEEHS